MPTHDLPEHEKNAIADRIMKDLERELLDHAWLLEQCDSTHGAAREHYKAEQNKSDKRIKKYKEELRILGRLN